MNGPCRFVLADDISINPVDMIAQRKPVSEKLYEKAVESIARREEEHKLKRINELRQKAATIRDKPYMGEYSKALTREQSHIGHFYEYNKDWKNKIEKKLQMEREEQQAKAILLAEEKKLRLKEHYESYLREKEKLQEERSFLRSKDQVPGKGKECPPRPPEPSRH